MTEKKVKMKIDKRVVSAKEGGDVIEICRENKVEIPTLCTHPDFTERDAVCRLCMVKVKYKGEKCYCWKPSCILKAESGMKIITQDAEIARARQTLLELLFAEHAGLCSNCQRNMDCELQDLSLKYSIDEFRFAFNIGDSDEEELEWLNEKYRRRVIDKINPSIARDSSKCIKCRRCIKACRDIQSVEALSNCKRGIETGVGTEYSTPLECTYCGQCSLHCPTAAITENPELIEVIRAIKNPNKVVIAQTAPSIRASLGEEFGMAPGSIVTGKMVAGLRKCGFDKIFDVNTGADLTITEEAAEFVDKYKKGDSLPIFTSCCPAWILFAEQNYPEILPYLSSARSPQSMLASIIKTYYARKIKTDPKNIVVVSIMPCTAKKYEIRRKELSKNGRRDIDHVLTTIETAELMKNLNIPFEDLPDEEFDPALGISTGAGAIFGATGGVAEAAARTAYYYITGKSIPKLDIKETRGLKGIKQAELRISGKRVRIGIGHGLKHARKLIEMVLKKECPFDMIEIMACPGGCIGGGGQPSPISDKVRKARIEAIYATDKGLPIRESHKNPVIKKLYKEFLYKPGSRKAEKLLHTHYKKYTWPLRKKHMESR